MDFKKDCLYEAGKTMVSANIISSDVRLRRILHARK